MNLAEPSAHRPRIRPNHDTGCGRSLRRVRFGLGNVRSRKVDDDERRRLGTGALSTRNAYSCYRENGGITVGVAGWVSVDRCICVVWQYRQT